MPARRDIRSILLVGSGPIVIGQACEFDYSGTQAAKALRGEGYRVILVNSNPATIMTDPEFADQTYVEPITAEVVERIIDMERPDTLLPTLGGQTALNITAELVGRGTLDRYGVELIGAGMEAIERAEDRGRFREVMAAAGLETPRAGYAKSMADARRIAARLGHPLMIRPSYILGGGGTGMAYNARQFEEVAQRGTGRLAGGRDPGRAVGGGLEGVRTGGHEGPCRQRGGDLFHRESGRHGGAHR